MTELFILDGSTIPEGHLAPEQVLAPGELRSYAKFRAESRRRDFLLGRLLLKMALTARNGGCVSDFPKISTTHTPAGKPFVDGAEFSLSHDNGVILLAIGDQPVGVDIETVQHFDEAMIQTCFSETEKQQVMNAPCPDSTATSLWCLKEATAKVAGRGLLPELGKTAGEEFFQRCGFLEIAGRQCAYALCSSLPIASIKITPAHTRFGDFLFPYCKSFIRSSAGAIGGSSLSGLSMNQYPVAQ